MRYRKHQELVRKHLDRLTERLFIEFTGLHFHIAWMAASREGWNPRPLPDGHWGCCRLKGSPLLPQCKTCGPRRLAATLESDRGHMFTCHLGVRNYWLRVSLRDETLGIAYLQALEHSVTSSGAGKHSAGAIVLGRVEFARAARLLRFVVQHVETASLSDLHQVDLSSAGRAVVALEREQARLHETLHRYLPANPLVPRKSGPETHAEQVVRSLLERIELDYMKPITLRSLARDLNMNGTYLSALFSRTIGMPFKSYLTELRLQKAKELLGDSTKTVSDVALAVGYAGEERFRCAFKKATGLSPRAWRETMVASSS